MVRARLHEDTSLQILWRLTPQMQPAGCWPHPHRHLIADLFYKPFISGSNRCHLSLYAECLPLGLGLGLGLGLILKLRLYSLGGGHLHVLSRLLQRLPDMWQQRDVVA